MSVTLINTHSPDAHPTAADVADAAPARRRVSREDLALYKAVFGGACGPIAVDPFVDGDTPDGGGGGPKPSFWSNRWRSAARLNAGPQDPMLASIARSGDRKPAANPWSPSAICMNLADYCDGLSLRLRRLPETPWVQHISKRVRQQVERAQARFTGPWVQ